MANDRYRTPLIFIAVVVLALIAYGVLTMRDNRTIGERVEDAAQQLESRTPGEKLGDAVKDAGDKIKEEVKPTENR